MKLFEEYDAVFEAIRFVEENLILVTRDGFIYYIYRPESKYWIKHKNAGNDRITVRNYQDISREELIEAMGGIFPQKETDFMRLCNPRQLRITDMFELLVEDYPNFMADQAVDYSVRRLLLESGVFHKSFQKVKELLEDAMISNKDNKEVLMQIKELSYELIGRDIFKNEIKIVDGHNSSSYFWIMPVRVIDQSNTNSMDSVAEMRSAEISIEEDDVNQYLTPFLYKYFDSELEANKQRIESSWEDDDGNEQISRVEGFEWYLTYNFFTFDSMKTMLRDMRDTIDALSSGRENEYTSKLREKRGFATYQLLYAKNMNQEQVDEYNASRPTEDDTAPELIIDFYRRFIYRMEYMLTVGKEKGYDLISFMGP